MIAHAATSGIRTIRAYSLLASTQCAFPSKKKRTGWKLPHKRKRSRRTRRFRIPLPRWFTLGGAFKTLAVLVIIGGLIGFSTLALAIAWVSRTLPDPGQLTERRVLESTRIYDRTGETLLYEIFSGEKRTYKTLDQIPDSLKWATIVVEDKDFYAHKGIDVKGIVRAVLVNTLERRRAQGGSTITQQFIKNAVLTHEKTYARKLKEFILALEVERRFSKDQILEMYLNEINYGGPNHGAESASTFYFGKPVEELSVAEAAVIAALPKAPSYYSPYGSRREELLARQRFILGALRDNHYITQAEYDAAKNEELVFTPRDVNILAPHFTLWVREQLASRYGEQALVEQGLSVITSLDLEKQRMAEEIIADIVPQNETNWNATNAALVAIDTKTGHVLAMVGSRDYFDETYDGNVNVTLRPRQPGSSFKPIVYTAAFEKGYTPETLLFDVETPFPTLVEGEYTPRNYDLSEHGVVTMRTALQGSLNIPAVKTIYLTGIGRVLDFAERLGYTTFRDRSRFGLSLVLGGGEVTLLEHTAAYATLARSGIAHPPVSILRVEDSKGNVLYNGNDTSGRRVIDEQVARQINNVLSDNAARSYVFGPSSLLQLGDRPVAVKTGTTNDYRDAWTMGYTPSLAVGVWGGNNDNSQMKRGAGGSRIAAPIWNAFMRRATAGLPVETFTEPSAPGEPGALKPVLRGEGMGATTVRIDRITGKLATDLTPESTTEEKIFYVLKPLLHFVDKDNPRGLPEDDPGRDPHYDFWLRAIEDWATRNDIIEALPPMEEDDVHTHANQPLVAITSPAPGSLLVPANPVTLSVNATAPRGVVRVEYYVDAVLWVRAEEEPFGFTALLNPGMASGEHTLTARAYDDVDNMGEVTVPFIVP